EATAGDDLSADVAGALCTFCACVEFGVPVRRFNLGHAGFENRNALVCARDRYGGVAGGGLDAIGFRSGAGFECDRPLGVEIGRERFRCGYGGALLVDLGFYLIQLVHASSGL